jgi:hypothetical protein
MDNNIDDIENIKIHFPNFDNFLNENKEIIKLNDLTLYLHSSSKIDNSSIEKFSKIIFKNDVNKNLFF